MSKFLIYPAEGDTDEDEGMTLPELAEMLVRDTTGYSLPALIECAGLLETISELAHDPFYLRVKAALAKLKGN